MTFAELETRLFSQTDSETAALRVLPETLRCAQLPVTPSPSGADAAALKAFAASPGCLSYALDARGFTSTDELFGPQAGMFHLAQQERYRAEPLHRHRFFELLVVYAGACTAQVEGETVALTAGDACLLNLNTWHRLLPLGAGDVVLCFRMKQELMSGSRMERAVGENPLMQQFYFARAQGAAVPSHLIVHCAGRDRFRATVQLMACEYFGSDRLSFSVLVGCFAPFFAELSRAWLPLAPEAETSRLEQALNYIRHFSRICTLEDTARRFGYAPTYLSALIRKQTGQSFSELRRACRLEAAAQLLVSTPDSVGDIAAAVGYSNLTWFYRAFQARYGMTPQQYRSLRRE